MLLKHMDNTLYIEGRADEARGAAEHEELMSRVRSRKEKRRIVYLG
jgi:hypothetical protein